MIGRKTHERHATGSDLASATASLPVDVRSYHIFALPPPLSYALSAGDPGRPATVRVLASPGVGPADIASDRNCTRAGADDDASPGGAVAFDASAAGAADLLRLAPEWLRPSVGANWSVVSFSCPGGVAGAANATVVTFTASEAAGGGGSDGTTGCTATAAAALEVAAKGYSIRVDPPPPQYVCASPGGGSAGAGAATASVELVAHLTGADLTADMLVGPISPPGDCTTQSFNGSSARIVCTGVPVGETRLAFNVHNERDGEMFILWGRGVRGGCEGAVRWVVSALTFLGRR